MFNIRPLRGKAFQILKASGLIIAVVGGLLLPVIEASHAGQKPEPKPPLKSLLNYEDLESASPAPQSKDTEVHLARRAIERESFYDSENPDLGMIQKFEEVTRGMPFDGNGFPDWMRALKEGSINPRASLNGQGKMEVLDLDIIMRNTREMPNVRFPHRSHTLWLACSNCHPAPFKPVAGSNQIRMADIFRGNFCGMCHDRVAFITFFSCSRCHSVPQGTASTAAAKPQ